MLKEGIGEGEEFKYVDSEMFDLEGIRDNNNIIKNGKYKKDILRLKILEVCWICFVLY